MINATGLTKRFKSYKKPPGFFASLKSLFYRQYETNYAVNSFDVHIEPGEIVGLLGPNGAGKTTLMKMFTGIITPSDGQLKVLGYIPAKRDRLFRKQIALVMGQKSQLWWDIPAMDSFQLLQRYYEIDNTAFQSRVAELAHLLGAEKFLDVHVRKLSLGERMKVELMACLLHEPKLIFLDEPTIGLDLIAQKNIRDFLKKYHEKTQTTIVLTSHYMADVEALCSRIILILDGKQGFDGPIGEFETLLGHEKNVSFLFSEQQDPINSLWKEYDAQWNKEHTEVDLRLPEEKLREVCAYILQHYPVIEFSTEKMPIERVMKTVMSNPKLIQ
ncbi:MAG: ATP-binding cassette domain-containing protein [SAR324 cluster bacterium]|nr:ATP-binding cassette domain-containing protein [SAR324 cluster bacterium]